MLTQNGSVSGSGVVQIGKNATWMLNGSTAATDTITFRDTGAALSIGSSLSYNGTTSVSTPYTVNATITGFQTGDSIILAQPVSTATYTAGTGTNPGKLVLSNATGAIETLRLTGDFTGKSFFVSPTTTGGASVSLLSPAAATYVLTAAPSTIAAGAGDDIFIATNATLNSRDRIDGGGGTNTLQLAGAGSFDLGAPAQLANIQVVKATEGQAPISGITDSTQTIYLRDGLALAVNVASGTPNHANSNPETITIYGSSANNVITLGSGTDTVVLGGAGETVIGGSGTALLKATTAEAGALVKGGGGKTTLEITNGGTATLNAATTNATVVLDTATNLTLSKMSFISAVGSHGADTITALASGQTLTGGAGADTLVGYSGFGDKFTDTAAGLNGDTIKLFGGTDQIDISDLTFGGSTKLTYAGNTTQGVLALTDGIHSARITMAGSFAAAHFDVATDLHGGTLVTYR